MGGVAVCSFLENFHTSKNAGPGAPTNEGAPAEAADLPDTAAQREIFGQGPEGRAQKEFFLAPGHQAWMWPLCPSLRGPNPTPGDSSPGLDESRREAPETAR